MTPTPFPKPCPACARLYTLADFLALPPLGVTPFPFGLSLDQRRCATCTTCIGRVFAAPVPVLAGDAARRAA